MKASIQTTDFIAFLKLFGEKGQIVDLEIGDTLYKREGWIDKTILKGNYSIEGILSLNYAFNGLQCFIGKIGGYQIILKSRVDEHFEFEIESNESNLRNLEFQVIEKNAYEPNLFDYSKVKQYDNQ